MTGRGSPCFPTTLREPLYEVTPVPDSTFVDGVAGQITVGRYSMRTVTFSDGALFCDVNHDFFDSTLNVPTVEAPATDNTTRLVPDESPPVGFSDGTCTTPATFASLSGPCGAPTPFTSESANCTGVTTIRAVGAALDGGLFLKGTSLDGGTICYFKAPSPVHAVSAPLPPSMFGETLSQHSGTGRLQYIDHATVDGFRWRHADAFDTQLQKACVVSSKGGPTDVCAPYEYEAQAGYSDSKCTQPIYFATAAKSCAAPPAGSTALVAATCPVKLLHVGAPRTTVYTRDSTGCSEYLGPTLDIYQCIDDIPPTALEQMTLVIQ
jgi:hypothetical protein